MSQELKGALFAILGGTCWGLSGSMGQYLFTSQGMDSRWLVPIRLGLAGMLLLVYSCLRGYDVFGPWKRKKTAVNLVVYGLLGVSMCQFFYFSTIQLSTAAAATILQDLSPIMILAVTCFSKKRLPGLTEVAAILLALAGVFLMVTHGSVDHFIISSLAVLTGVLSAVCVTIYNVTPGKLMEKFPVLLMQGWAFLMGGVFFALVFRPWTFHYVPAAMGYIGIAFVVLVGNVMAFPLYMLGVKYAGPEKAILYGFSEPVSAAIVGILLLGNSFSVYDLAGFVLVFAMLVLISKPKKEDAVKDKSPSN